MQEVIRFTILQYFSLFRLCMNWHVFCLSAHSVRSKRDYAFRCAKGNVKSYMKWEKIQEHQCLNLLAIIVRKYYAFVFEWGGTTFCWKTFSASHSDSWAWAKWDCKNGPRWKYVRDLVLPKSDLVNSDILDIWDNLNLFLQMTTALYAPTHAMHCIQG